MPNAGFGLLWPSGFSNYLCAQQCLETQAYYEIPSDLSVETVERL